MQVEVGQHLLVTDQAAAAALAQLDKMEHLPKVATAALVAKVLSPE
jgi:hypothetical protein